MSKKSAETPLMRQYYQIKNQHPDAILLFRVGDFYETFAEDAVDSSKILGITLTKRANGSSQYIDLAGFPYHALDTYLPKLVRAGRRVAICEQLEDPKTTKKIVKRGITELVTPGLALSDTLLDGKENNFLASIILDKNDNAGLALLDISTGEFLCSEGKLDDINKLIINYSPKELLFEYSQKSRILQKINFNASTYDMEDWAFAFNNNNNILLKHFGVNSLKGFGIENNTLAISAAGAILNYLELTSHNKISHISAIRKIDRSSFVRMDDFTLRSLEIIHKMNAEAISLYDIINMTKTAMGNRLLRKWLVFPLNSIDDIKLRQNYVEELYNDKNLRYDISSLLSDIGDIERLISRASVAKISPREVIQLASSLDAISDLKDALSKSNSELLRVFANNIDYCGDLRDRIKREIRPDAPLLLGRSDTIAPNVSAELDELRELLSHGKDYLIQMQQREIEATGINSLKIAYNNVFGYYIEVRNTHKDKVPNTWIRKQTLVNAERYITEELKHYEEKILGAEEKIIAIEKKIFEDLLLYLTQYIIRLQDLAMKIAVFDCYYGFAEVADAYRYQKPEINNSNKIEIIAGRHPVIERQLGRENPYIANDVLLNDEDTQIMMITGPNMSGKSSLLRQTALIVLLAQIGAFVPADKASIGVVDAIFTRVGANDNISRGESTFMVEMQEASNILNNLSDRSLVLFDELGRGTSTYDGISIAWAIVEYLHNGKNKAKTMFATHYHELNELEKHLERVKNYNVSAKEVDGRMLFLRKLERGGSEHSFGIQVAKLGGMPQSIVSRATNILGELEQDVDIKAEHIKDTSTIKSKKETKDSAENQAIQLSIFQLDDPLLSEIREELLGLDINNLTPIEALNKLNYIQKLLK